MATTQPPLVTKDLTPAQRRNLQFLIGQADRAEWEIEQATKARDKAIENANNFLGYCADEHEIKLGTDGWKFVQAELRFVQEPPASNNGDGSEGS